MVLNLLLQNPLLVLFVIAGLGYLLGRITIGGSSLGVAAVLFVGLGFGALHPDLKVPEIVYQLGLVLFIYTIGLSSGPIFVASFRGTGLRDTLATIGIIGMAAALTIGASMALGLSAPASAGVFAGSLTNTPALAGVLEYLGTHAPAATRDAVLAEPVVAYSLAYPVSVLTVIFLIAAAQRAWTIDYRADERAHATARADGQPLQQRTIRISHALPHQPVATLIQTQGWPIIFGRIKHAGELGLVTDETCFAVGDIVTAIGTADVLDQAIALLGEASEEHIELDRSAIDYRRMLVSNPEVIGQPLRRLNLPHRFGAVITRVRRGDVELLPHGDTTLLPGDRVRVVTRREHLEAVSRFFGDSDRAVSEIDILSFSLGITAGILLGLVPLPLPGGITIKLGMAGGPLVVALILGARYRTGPIIWALPYSANLVLRQIGLICFLAGIGTRAGYAFLTTLTAGAGWAVLAVAALIAGVTAMVTLWIGHRVLKMPMGLVVGMLAGIQTQPATLGFALEQTGNELPNVAYATSFPVAVITKIILAQLLLILLR